METQAAFLQGSPAEDPLFIGKFDLWSYALRLIGQGPP